MFFRKGTSTFEFSSLTTASSDDTPAVGEQLAANDSRVIFRRHAVNLGHIKTFNEGVMDWARAQYSLLLSADDALAPGALARAVKVMDSHEDVGLSYGMAGNHLR